MKNMTHNEYFAFLKQIHGQIAAELIAYNIHSFFDFEFLKSSPKEGYRMQFGLRRLKKNFKDKEWVISSIVGVTSEVTDWETTIWKIAYNKIIYDLGKLKAFELERIVNSTRYEKYLKLKKQGRRVKSKQKIKKISISTPVLRKHEVHSYRN